VQEYEAFVRFRKGEPLQHVGSVRAPDPESALEAAYHIFLRRDTFERLWVVDRRFIAEMIPDAEWDRRRIQETELRRPSFYVRKLAAAGYTPPKLSTG
jgi:phenylacetate-CoA oxygenase PaaH subunit